MYEKNKWKLMMDRNAEDVMYQRRKKYWLSYGRALLTIAILGLLTLSLYVWAQSSKSHNEHEEHNSKHVIVGEDESFPQSGSFKESEKIIPSDGIAFNDQLRNPRIVKRNANLQDNENSIKMPKNFDKSSEQSFQSLNDVNSDNDPKMDSEHLKLIRRQQGSNQNLQHRHSDGVTYYFKGYKCVPIRKPEQLKLSDTSRSSNRPRTGMSNCISSHSIVCKRMIASFEHFLKLNNFMHLHRNAILRLRRFPIHSFIQSNSKPSLNVGSCESCFVIVIS